MATEGKEELPTATPSEETLAEQLGDVKLEDAPVETPAEPVETPAEPVETPAEPVETPAEPVETPAEPVETPVETVDTPKEEKPLETVPKEVSAEAVEPAPPTDVATKHSIVDKISDKLHKLVGKDSS